MKKLYKVRMVVALLLVYAMAVNMTGCAVQIKAENVMKGITPNPVTPAEDISSQNPEITKFAVKLFKAAETGEGNTLISPLSVLCALAMTVNGAEGQTREQMEAVLGMTAEELNLYVYSYTQGLPQGNKYKLSIANSVWFTQDESFSVNRDFLQINADYYGSDIYRTPFDTQTCKDINNWVKKNTDGMIPKILDAIPPGAVMYLVNALAFDAEWSSIYQKDQVHDGVFTKEDGTDQTVEFMRSSEYTYLEDEKATGFLKYFKGRYAVAALLPKEGVDLSDYIASLDGEAVHTLLTKPQRTTVHTAIPKFEIEYSIEMSEILAQMGMDRAFNGAIAEFGGLGTCTEGNIAINRVLHKTFITVDERGTKAGAVTMVEANSSGMPEEPKEVYLTRPFVYMLIDTQNHIPFFIGTVRDVTG